MISIQAQDPHCSARTGVLHLAHGDVLTPAFMPVGTNAAVKAMLHKSLEDIGYRLILGNTYHLHLRPGIDVIKEFGSLHNFSSWPHNLLTDSGGFQVFSLAASRRISPEGVEFRSHIDGSLHQLTPEKVVDIQTILDSDIQMQLDVCTAPRISEKEAREALRLTTDWARRSKARLACKEGYRGALFGIIQGNFYESLRRESAEQLAELKLPGYAIGGLSVGEDSQTFKHFLHFTAPLLSAMKPKYVMGIGTPDYMLEAIEAGIDIFDCVYPTRVARNGTCFTNTGMLNLKNAHFQKDQRPIMDGCLCPACTRYSRAYIRHLFVTKEILGPILTTSHNLQFLFNMMKAARDSIERGRFNEFKNDFLGNFESQKP